MSARNDIAFLAARRLPLHGNVASCLRQLVSPRN
jgi:hypothetical protein